MKKHLISLLLVFGLASISSAQVFTSQYGSRFNEAQKIAHKTGFKASSANDTLNSFSIAGASNLRLFGKGTDSTVALIYYRLSNSTTGAITAWTAMADTIGTDGVGTAPNATGPLALKERTGGTLAQSDLLGFDTIQFYIDALSGTAAGNDGGSNVFELFLFLVPTVR